MKPFTRAPCDGGDAGELRRVAARRRRCAGRRGGGSRADRLRIAAEDFVEHAHDRLGPVVGDRIEDRAGLTAGLDQAILAQLSQLLG
jgi:hypothetical protein